MQEILKHTLFIGLNDKDLHKQILTTKKAKNLIIKTLLKYYEDGFTLSTCEGVYKKEIEKTIKIEVLFANESKTIKAIKELKTLLNQNCIALQVENITSDLI